MASLRPLPLGHGGTSKDIQYYEYECAECGKTERNTYVDPYRERLLERRLCYICNHWHEFAEEKAPREQVIINGNIYGLGNRTSGEFRGMGGRRFDIEFLETSVYAGQKTTCFDLWSGGVLPERLRAKFPDTARFLGGAKTAKTEGVRYWNPSLSREQPWPPPSALVKTAT